VQTPHEGNTVIRRLTPPAWLLVLVTSLALALAYLQVPLGTTRNATRVVLDLTAAIAVAVAVRRRRPAYALPWWCFAAAAGFAVVGDAITFWYVEVARTAPPFPSAADGAYLMIGTSVAVGLYLLSRRRIPGQHLGHALDALVVAIAGGMIAGVFLLAPYADNVLLSQVQQALTVTYPALDVLVLCLVGRLMLRGGVRTRALRLIGGGWVVALGADLTFSVALLHGTYRPGSVIEAGWLVAFGLLAAAAAHPRMAEIGEAPARPAKANDGRLGRARLVTLLAAALTPSTVLLANGLWHGRLHVPLVAISSAVLMAMVFGRLVLLAAENTALRTEAERRRVAEEAAREAERLAHQQTQFATMAAHELRTPLTALRGSLTTLLGNGAALPDDVRAELLGMAVRQADRLERVCGDLDVVVQSDSGGLSVLAEDVAVAVTAREVVTSLGFDAIARTTIRVPEGLDVVADGVRLAQMLGNLVRNALRYAPPGSPVLLEAFEDGDDIAIEVADRGPGLDAEMAGTAFDRFGLRAAGATGGFGIGLWIVRELAAAMGGAVSYAARPGGGAVFRVTLAAAPRRAFASVG
jgi:signal transduction histidine kinase